MDGVDDVSRRWMLTPGERTEIGGVGPRRSARRSSAGAFGGLGRVVPELPGMVRAAVVVAVLRVPVLIGMPLVVRRLFDHALPRRDGFEVSVIGLGVLALYLVDAGLLLMLRRKVASQATAAVAGVRTQAIVRIYSRPMSWHASEDPGILHGLVVQDCDRLQLVLSQLLMWIVPTGVTFAALAVLAVVVAPGLAALLGLGLLVTSAVAVPLARRTVREGRRTSEVMRLLGARWRTSLRLLPETQLHGAEAVEVGRRSADAQRIGDHSRHLQNTQAALLFAVDVTTAVIAAMTLVAGGLAITRGSMTVGTLLSFYAIGALVLRQVTVAAPGVTSALSDAGSVERLAELLTTEVPPAYAGKRQHVALGGVELKGVTFGFDPARPVLRDVDLTLRPGDHVAILGPNGAGKSTLVALLLGLYEPDRGQICIDGIPMSDLDVGALRRTIGVATQDPVIFAGTIGENIAYARPAATRDEVLAAAALGSVDEVARSLGAGLDTQVGDEGVRLSGGQRQRVALARALVGSPRLVILDEPSTYLDDAATDELVGRLDDLPNRPTILTITHDPRVAASADRIVCIRDGRIEPGEGR